MPNFFSQKTDPLESYKRYLRLAGIRVKNYEKLFEGCKSLKSKKELILNMLEEMGLEGELYIKFIML